METAVKTQWVKEKKSVQLLLGTLTGAGILLFVVLAIGGHPKTAWMIYLVNFLLLTAISLGAVLFSTLMHFTRARWSHHIAAVAESFTAFFPVSLVLFMVLFVGQNHVFPWIGEDLHGKEIWLNVPFLFVRDLAGFVTLFGLGMVYTSYSLRLRLVNLGADTPLKQHLFNRWQKNNLGPEQLKEKKTLFAGLYMLFFALVLSMIGFDLVMAMDPHWYSTLFGAYSFIKAIYAGFGGLILLCCILHLSPSVPFSLTPKNLGDLSTLFFGFSIVWGDFFYSQFVVIWYGNISEETTYIIERTMTAPWQGFAWTVFLVCFILPFLILLSRRIKQSPVLMIIMCSLVLTGFWLEHFLLLGPIYLHGVNMVGTGISALIVTTGFFALLVMALRFYLRQFPELMDIDFGEVVQWK